MFHTMWKIRKILQILDDRILGRPRLPSQSQGGNLPANLGRKGAPSKLRLGGILVNYCILTVRKIPVCSRFPAVHWDSISTVPASPQV